MIDACYYTSAQTHRMYNTKSEAKGKLQIFSDYVMMVCPCSPIDCNKCPTLVSNVGNGVCMCGLRVYGKISEPSAQFCWEFKTALKILFFKKNGTFQKFQNEKSLIYDPNLEIIKEK